MIASWWCRPKSISRCTAVAPCSHAVSPATGPLALGVRLSEPSAASLWGARARVAWVSAPCRSSVESTGEYSPGLMHAPRAAAMSGGPYSVGLLVGAGGTAGTIATLLQSPMDEGMMRSPASSTMPIRAATWLRCDRD